MKFLSILKKIGLGVLEAEGIYKDYSPAISLIPGSEKVMDKLELASKVVADAEIMGQAINAKGTQKAAMAAPAMFQLLMDLPILQGKKPKDPAKAKADAQRLGGDLAEFLNNFE